LLQRSQPVPFTFVRTLLHAGTEAGDAIDLDIRLPAWEHVEKFNRAEPFRQTVKTTFAYSEENPCLLG
jgi:hypothetical protein